VLNPGQLARLRRENPYTAELIDALNQSINRLNNFHGLDTSGQVTPPPAPGSFVITATNGRFVGTIIDKSAVNKGINYWVEYAADASFQNAIQVCLVASRDFDKFLGSGTFFFRCFSQYPLSPPSPKILSTPPSLAGGGAIAGPALPAEQGSGTSPISGQGFGGAPEQPPGEFPGFTRALFR
jgi:hypothetical protein